MDSHYFTRFQYYWFDFFNDSIFYFLKNFGGKISGPGWYRKFVFLSEVFSSYFLDNIAHSVTILTLHDPLSGTTCFTHFRIHILLYLNPEIYTFFTKYKLVFILKMLKNFFIHGHTCPKRLLQSLLDRQAQDSPRCVEL